MATLKELHDLMIHSGISADTVTMIITEARLRFGGDKIYFPPPGSRKDPARAEAIRDAAKRLPTGVVTQRFGVHRSYVYKVSKK